MAAFFRARELPRQTSIDADMGGGTL